VKFCGITRIEDARLAVDLGVDALGFVFYENSPRYIAPEDATNIIRRLPPLVSKVGLFVDASHDEIARVLSQVPIDLVQFHGTESAAACELVGRPYVKAVRMAEGVDLAAEAARFASATALLLDAYADGVAGGTGAVFEWERVPNAFSKPIILAGGLNASNVASAIAAVEPYAIDVSTGIESDKGVKDPAKMAEFMLEVTGIERNLNH
jgi:phosphoribosylanthranilate isomerase